MNDEFLYELRTQPSARFAARLKARLEFQAATAAAKRRAMKWYAFFGILLGTAAVAAVTPIVRTTMGSWFGDVAANRDAVPVLSRDAEVSSSPDIGRTTAIGRGGAVTAEPGTQASIPSRSATPDINAPSQSISGAAPAPRRRVSAAIGAPVPQEVADMMIESFEEAYGYTVDRKLVAADEAICGFTPVDVIVTLGPLSEPQQDSCKRRGVSLVDVEIGHDAYVAFVHRDTTWVDALTLQDLRTMARTPRDLLTTWNQLRPSWPSLPLVLFGVDATNRTLSEYFDPHRVAYEFPPMVRRNDGSAIAVSATYGSLGFMSFETYRTQHDAEVKRGGLVPVKLLGITNQRGEIVMPSLQTIQEGRYDMLSRPLMLHLNAFGLRRHEVLLFGTHAVEGSSQRLREHGLTPIDKVQMDTAARTLRAASAGQ